MKSRFLDLLVCPTCKGDLSLRADQASGDDVMSGTLSCGACRAGYPIAGGIPRFVAQDGYAESFGDEWHRFRRESEDRFRLKIGLGPADVRGRLVLDAGVGAGRYAEVMARWGAEVVSVDLTRAVDAATENLRAWPRVHLVQADIFALPFHDETFDIAYSMGVHHTPDTATAFRRVPAAVKKGGQLAVYVYLAGGLARYVSDALRVITTRLPRQLVYYVSAVAIPLYCLHRLPVVGWLDRFDWYTPRYQWKHRYPEVLRWFREAAFSDLYVADEPTCVHGLKVLAP